MPLKDGVSRYCMYLLCIRSASQLFIWSLFPPSFSLHIIFFLLLSHFAGVILHLPLGVIQLVTWREISGVTDKWIFHCNRLKSILPSIETHQQAPIALSALSAFLSDEIRFLNKRIHFMIPSWDLFIVTVLHLIHSRFDVSGSFSSRKPVLLPLFWLTFFLKQSIGVWLKFQ